MEQSLDRQLYQKNSKSSGMEIKKDKTKYHAFKGRLREMSSEERVSRALSKILRHQAKERGIKLNEQGYAVLSEVLKLPEFKGVNEELIQKVVKDNDKQRFDLVEEHHQLWIRCNQGHSAKEAENLD